jgi:transposase
MENVSIVGIDLAKRSVQLHGAAADCSVVFRKKLSRPRLTAFLSELPRCVVAIEACGASHYWGVRSASLAMRRVLSHLFTLSRVYQ